MINTSKGALQKTAMSRLNRTISNARMESIGKRGLKEMNKEESKELKLKYATGLK